MEQKGERDCGFRIADYGMKGFSFLFFFPDTRHLKPQLLLFAIWNFCHSRILMSWTGSCNVTYYRLASG